jgi:hypothetical protein
MNERVKALLEQVRQTADFGYVTFDDINSTNALGDSALHCVCVWGDIEAARVLIERESTSTRKGSTNTLPWPLPRHSSTLTSQNCCALWAL